MPRIDDSLEIPDDELVFEVARAGGPGGQNVNKVETKVTALFDVAGSPSLGPEQRERIRERLSTRINKAGLLRVTSQRHRTQKANRDAVVERFAELLAAALAEVAPRVPTRTPRGARLRRLAGKRRRGEQKRLRSGDALAEE